MKHLPLLLLLLLAGQLQAQTHFNNRLPLNSGFSAGLAVLPLRQGGYLIGGRGADLTQIDRDMMLCFTDVGGQPLQTLTNNIPNSVLYTGTAGCLTYARDGGFTLIGSIVDSISSDLMLWRFNAQGDTLWTKRYGSSISNEAGYTGRQLPNGDYIILGIQDVGTAAGTASELDYWLIRTDSLGNMRWQRHFGTQSFEYAFSLEPTLDGGFIIGGFTARNSLQITDLLVIKTDSAGNTEWQKTYGSPADDEGFPMICPVSTGGYLMASTTSTQVVYATNGMPLRWYSRPTFTRLDSAGNVLWQRSYGPSRQSSEIYAVHELPGGSFAAIGQQRDSADQGVEAMLVKVCHNGDSLWYRTHKVLQGPNSKNYPRDMHPTADGGYVIAGFLHVRPPDTGTPDTWLFKTDSLGCLQPGCPPPTATCVRLAVEEELKETQPALFKLYPNPFSSVVQLEYHLPEHEAQGQLQLQNALGQVVQRISLSGHEGQQSIDLSALPEGVYFYSFTSADGKLLQAGKLVRMR